MLRPAFGLGEDRNRELYDRPLLLLPTKLRTAFGLGEDRNQLQVEANILIDRFKLGAAVGLGEDRNVEVDERDLRRLVSCARPSGWARIATGSSRWRGKVV